VILSVLRCLHKGEELLRWVLWYRGYHARGRIWGSKVVLIYPLPHGWLGALAQVASGWGEAREQSKKGVCPTSENPLLH